MARGNAEQKRRAEQLQSYYQNWLGEQRGTQGALRQRMMPEIEGLLQSEGYSPEEQSAITGRTMESLDSGFSSGEQAINRQSAMSGNRAGGAANVRELYAERGRSKSDAARGLKERFADEKLRRRMAGLQALQGLYGSETGLVSNIAGLPVSALNARAQGLGQGMSLGPLGSWG